MKKKIIIYLVFLFSIMSHSCFGTWALTTLCDDACSGMNLLIKQNAIGKVICVWKHCHEDNRYLEVGVWDGSEWSVSLLSNFSYDIEKVDAYINTSGQIAVLWSEFSYTGLIKSSNIKISLWNGSAWSTSTLVSSCNLVEELGFKMNENGSVIVECIIVNDFTDYYLKGFLWQGVEWSEINSYSSETAIYKDLFVDMNESDDIAVSWREFSSEICYIKTGLWRN